MSNLWDGDLEDVISLIVLVLILVVALLILVGMAVDESNERLIHQRCLDAGYTEYRVANDDQAYCTKLVNGNTKVIKLED